MKPWFIQEDNVIPFPKKDTSVVRLPNVNAYPDFLTGVQDLQNHLKQGDISSDIHKKLYQDLIHRFMKVESFETPWFLKEELIQEYRTSTEYKGYKIEIHRTKVKPPYVATITSQSTKRELQRQGGETEQEALKNAQDSIDSMEAQAPTISSDSTTSILFNTLASGELLKDPSIYNDIYAKIDQGEAGPILVIGNETYGADALLKAGFKKSSDRRPVKQKTSSEESMPQVMFPFSGSDLKDAGIKVNGRYVMDIEGQYQDEYQHTVYPLTFVGTTIHSRDTLRMSKPGFTVGTKRNEDVERPWFLREAVGISGRKPGDVFQNIKDVKNQITFDTFKAFPEGKLKFVDINQRDRAIEKIKKQIPTLIPINKPNNSQLAFGLAIFNSQSGQQGYIKFGRDVQQVNNPGWWGNKDIPNYEPYFAAARKSQKGFGPASIFGTKTSKKTPLTPNQIVTQINSVLGESFSNPVKEIITKKTLPTFKGQAENATAIRDNFGEVFGPVALVAGASGITGPYKDAEKYLGDFSACGIFYPTQQANPLCDSYLIASNGKEVGISSKGKSGANASIFTLAKNIKELQMNDPTNPLLKTYKFTVDTLNFLDDHTLIDGPIDLAQTLGMINAKTSGQIKSLWNPRSEEKDIAKYPELTKIYNLYPFKSGPDDKNFRLRFAILANIAKAVCEKINSTKGFGEGALAFLNQSQIVQAYTQVNVSDKDVIVKEIRTIYPPNFQGTLILNGGKNYYSTNAVGKIAFDFKPA